MSTTDFFDSQKPQYTSTITQFIACQSDTDICYENLSFIDQYDYIKYNTYNVLSDYIDEIRDAYCKQIVLSTEEAFKYKYKPKLLCYDVYGSGELAFIILIINDMYNVKDFTKTTLLMPTKDNMNTIIKYMYNANKNAIAIYNEKNNHDL